MTISVIEGILSSDVADDGTFTVNYPSGKDEGHFAMGVGHKIILTGYGTFEHPSGVFLTFGSSNITVKNVSGNSWAEDTKYRLQLEEIGDRVFRVGQQSYDRNKAATLPVSQPSLALNAWKGELTIVSLGAPDTADANGVCESQAGTADTAMTIDGALASGGVATFDVPRNVVGAWTNNATLTITGTDAYGNTVVETTGSAGTSHTGKKAFKTITSVVPSANITGATVGTGDVLGLPVFLPATGLILAELEDGSAPTAGTAVAGDQTEGGSTATTGDVRGTYDPNSAADGDKYFHLVLALPDPSYIGLDQYAG